MISKPQIKKLAKELYAWNMSHTAGEAKQAAEDVVKLFYKKGAVRQLKELVAVLETMDEKAHGVSRVDIAAAFPLSAATQEKIVKMIHAGESVVRTTINPALLGGVKIRCNDQLIDLSLQHQLHNLLG